MKKKKLQIRKFHQESHDFSEERGSFPLTPEKDVFPRKMTFPPVRVCWRDPGGTRGRG